MSKLVLTRKPQQSIRIGDEVIITITRVTGSTATICIEAPLDIKIVRSELLDFADHKPQLIADQHTGPLEADGGPASPPQLGATERVEDSGIFEGDDAA